MGSINHLSKFIPNAASLTDQLRPLLREENEQKKKKNIKLPVKKFERGEQHSLIFEENKKRWQGSHKSITTIHTKILG